MTGSRPQATTGVAWMLTATVLYTAANLCVKSLAHLPTEELVFLGRKPKMAANSRHLWNHRFGSILSHDSLYTPCQRHGNPIPQPHIYGAFGHKV